MSFKVVNVNLSLRGRVLSVNPRTKGYRIAYDMRDLRKGFAALKGDLRILNRKELIVPKDTDGDSSQNFLVFSGGSVIICHSAGKRGGDQWQLRLRMANGALLFTHTTHQWKSYNGDCSNIRDVYFSPTGIFTDASQQAESRGNSVCGNSRPEHRKQDSNKYPLQAIIFEKKKYNSDDFTFWLVVNPSVRSQVRERACMSWLEVAPKDTARTVFSGKSRHTLQIPGIKV